MHIQISLSAHLVTVMFVYVLIVGGCAAGWHKLNLHLNKPTGPL